MDARGSASKKKMARIYTLKKRAEQQAETRQRIVEATVELHSSVGPALTTISMVAERAGVQRHTVYAHFPDERSLFTACSGLVEERDPIPEAAAWRDIADRRERLMAGIGEIYGWFERNAALLALVLRDAQHHQVTRETSQRQFGPPIAAWHEALGERLTAKQRAMLHVALSYYTWRNLALDAGLEQGEAVDLMVRAIECAESAGK
jgi:AcrR family transcriptional regulator